MDDSVWIYLGIGGVILLISIYTICDKIKQIITRKKNEKLSKIPKEENKVKNLNENEKNLLKEKLRSKLLLHEDEIKNSLKSIDIISEEVKQLEIEVFIENLEGNLDIRLFSMDNDDNEVTLKDKSTFSGSIDLSSKIETINIESLGEKEFKEVVIKVLAEIIKKHVTHIKIPISINFHGSDDIYAI